MQQIGVVNLSQKKNTKARSSCYGVRPTALPALVQLLADKPLWALALAACSTLLGGRRERVLITGLKAKVLHISNLQGFRTASNLTCFL